MKNLSIRHAMLLVSVTFAQSALDALPFSTYNPNGSAGYRQLADQCIAGWRYQFHLYKSGWFGTV